jgi:hypothetical protein
MSQALHWSGPKVRICAKPRDHTAIIHHSLTLDGASSNIDRVVLRRLVQCECGAIVRRCICARHLRKRWLDCHLLWREEAVANLQHAAILTHNQRVVFAEAESLHSIAKILNRPGLPAKSAGLDAMPELP